VDREPIYFDARYIRVDHHDGISRFSAGLIAELAELTPVVAIISDQRQLEKLPIGIPHVYLNDPTSWQEPFAALKLNRLKPSLVYSPMQTIGALGRRFKLVLTLHDLIYYRHPKPPPSLPLSVRIGWRLFHLTYWPQRWVLNQADAVVTVSQTTRALMRANHLTKRNIHVVYNAAGNLDPDLAENPLAQRPREVQRLIYMGSFMDYKNVETLIAGMADLPGYELHLLSRITPERQAKLLAQHRTYGGAVVFHNGVTEEKYHELLTQSVALVSASLDEGFGIPLVEAMARGIPVAVSDIPIFREIGAEAAQYFEANSPSGFASAIKSLESPQIWNERSRVSFEQARKFSWGRSAVALLEALKSVEI
jgi:glycosyltransferase involved in cell wall biosynthesis